eukprot:SAG25_NODE_498_length_7397_cov_3.070978_1_plen_237_part_00
MNKGPVTPYHTLSKHLIFAANPQTTFICSYGPLGLGGAVSRQLTPAASPRFWTTNLTVAPLLQAQVQCRRTLPTRLDAHHRGGIAATSVRPATQRSSFCITCGVSLQLYNSSCMTPQKMTFFCLSCSSSQRHHTPVSCQNMCEELLHTAEKLLHTRWSEGGQNNLAAAWAQWKHHCDTINAGDSVGGQLDVLNPTPPQLVEFLRAVRKAATASADNGRPWKLQHPHKNNFPGYQLS